MLKEFPTLERVIGVSSPLDKNIKDEQGLILTVKQDI